MGLFLGASVITLFEILDLLIYNGYKKMTEKKTQDKSSENTKRI